jgi:predicted chitinase
MTQPADPAAPKNEVPKPGTVSYLDQITKAAAVFGALIATGQAGTSWISGYWTSQAELHKKEKELELSQIKARSDLAESYIKLIIAKETKDADQVMLMGALSELKDHPLQEWAKKRFAERQRNLDAFNRAQLARSEALELKTDTERRLAELVADIQALSAERELRREDVAESNRLQALIRAKQIDLEEARGTLRVVTKVETEIVATSTVQTVTTPASTDAISALERKINVELLMTAFPEQARQNIQADVGFLAAAMKEAQIADSRLAAAIIATIAVEAPLFERFEEPQSKFNTKEQPFDLYESGTRVGALLGNTQPGDGARFKGRGYVGLTGRDNYRRTAARLNTDIVSSPDLAKRPDVAARIICDFFLARLSQITAALDRNDLLVARRLVNGGSRGFDEFSNAYNKVLAKLNRA